MSIIIVKKEKDRIIIGADSQETSGDSTQENLYQSKLRLVQDNVYVGTVGDGHVGSLLYAYLEKNSISGVTSAYELIEFFKSFLDWCNDYIIDEDSKMTASVMSQFVIINHASVWYFNNFYVRELKEDEVAALGSGRQAALAAMHLGSTVEEALNVTCKVDIYCSLPLTMFEVSI